MEGNKLALRPAAKFSIYNGINSGNGNPKDCSRPAAVAEGENKNIAIYSENKNF